jgi:hypothetical protein
MSKAVVLFGILFQVICEGLWCWCMTLRIVDFWTSNTFQKLDLFPSSSERVGAPTLLGPLERDNLIHWTTANVKVYFTSLASYAMVILIFLPSFPSLGATAQGELWPPEQSASILLYSSFHPFTSILRRSLYTSSNHLLMSISIQSIHPRLIVRFLNNLVFTVWGC